MSDEEYINVSGLLDANNIAYYVTPRGNWGAMEAIWLIKDDQLDEAKDILNAYYKTTSTIKAGNVLPKILFLLIIFFASLAVLLIWIKT